MSTVTHETPTPTTPAANGAAGERKVQRAESHPLHTLTGVQVIGTGAYTPDKVVRNEDLAALGYDDEWIVQRTGILERRMAAPSEATSDLAFGAARRAIEAAGISPSEIDLVIVGTLTPDQPTPSTACILADRMGISAPAFDVNAACAGFMYGLTTGMQFVKAGTAKRVLVIGADIMSRVCNPEDKKTYPLFGDAAGAVVLAPGDQGQGLLSYTIGADGAGGDLLCIPGGGSREPLSAQALADKRQFILMEGRPVFQWAVQLLRDTISAVLEDSGIAPADVNLVVLHQANARIIDAAMNKLDIPADRVFVNLDRYGNTSAGSIPLALDEAHRSGRIKPGDHVVLSGFGAGLAWGTAMMRW